MCYDVKTNLESQLKRAKRFNDKNWIEDLEEKLLPNKDSVYYHVSGYTHPKLLIYTNDKPYIPTVSIWGFVPHWIKNNDQRLKFWNNTLNARGETIFEKPSFRDSAKNKRCILNIDGFYEHHHFKGKTYPFFISRKDGRPLSIAGLWCEWIDKETGEILNTFTIVTVKGNSLMAKIHNNPKLIEPRMPVILTEETEDIWLEPINNERYRKEIIKLIQPYPENKLKAHTVRRLRGKEAVGNVPEASAYFKYNGLEVA
jgi:putative SOS response-associated peptidase YedK